jgi:oligoribonuclease NrnB/cAMP/cGMP phosphodiesterase (DHH superfamily)
LAFTFTLSLFWLLFALPGCAQQFSPPHTRRVDGTISSPGDPDSRDGLLREMAKKANLERQAAIKTDTEKLLKLAGELKEYVGKSNENILSMDVLKKAEEIEKLAHSVKDKMKGPN